MRPILNMITSYPHIYTEHHCCNAMYYAKKVGEVVTVMKFVDGSQKLFNF